MRALIVGTGPTGAGICRYLRKNLRNKVKEIVVFDKARGPGGRFATHRLDSNEWIKADTGAQYITQGAGSTAPDLEVYEELETSGTIRRLPEEQVFGVREKTGKSHFVAPEGLSSVPKYMLDRFDARVRYSTRLCRLERREGSKWSTTCETYDRGTVEDIFDVVFLTIPATQLLADVKGDTHFERILSPHRHRLENVQYSRRFAAVCRFDGPIDALSNIKWTTAYVDDCESLRYVSNETRKMNLDSGADSSGGVTLLLHSSVPYAIEHFDTPRDLVRDHMLGDLARFLNCDLPEPSYTKVHRWKYSQCMAPGELSASPALSLGDGLYIAGDGLVGSNFDNCMRSAKFVVDAFLSDHANALL